MTSQPADEDILIQAARSERGQHRSGASMVGMLGAAAAFGVVGCFLIFVPRLIAMLLPLPVSLLLGGFSLPVFVTLGVVALGIAGFFLLAAFASSPLASWGNKLPGDCPTLRPGPAALGHGAGQGERHRQGCATRRRHPVRDPRLRLRGCPRHPRKRRDFS